MPQSEPRPYTIVGGPLDGYSLTLPAAVGDPLRLECRWTTGAYLPVEVPAEGEWDASVVLHWRSD
ncbi:hypothetical protein ACIRQY_29055 [Streptomyces sp. NPDC101490]|uniref:hypothetical protein n=1 Tax=Streptomyces sp. NPDC101490 TaxID=3366143 RepID=UPI0038092C39